jgi:hypothetical protein
VSGGSSLLGRGTWFNPGPATLVVRPAGWMLLVPGVKSSLVASAWRVLGDPPAADALLADLAAGSEFETEERLPPVLFGLGAGADLTIGLTGTSPLAVYAAQGRSLLTGTADGPAVITEVSDVRRIAFGDLPAEDPRAALRTVEGMSRVRGFVVATVDPGELEESARAQLAEEVEADGSSILDPAEKERAAQRREARAKEKREREARRAQDDAAREASSSARSSSRPSSSSSARAAAEAPAGPSMFDDLFAPSASTQGAVAPAPEREPATEPDAAPEPTPAAAAPEPTPTAAPPEHPHCSGPDCQRALTCAFAGPLTRACVRTSTRTRTRVRAGRVRPRTRVRAGGVRPGARTGIRVRGGAAPRPGLRTRPLDATGELVAVRSPHVRRRLARVADATVSSVAVASQSQSSAPAPAPGPAPAPSAHTPTPSSPAPASPAPASATPASPAPEAEDPAAGSAPVTRVEPIDPDAHAPTDAHPGRRPMPPTRRPRRPLPAPPVRADWER